MGVLTLIFVTFFAAVIVGSVLLIQLGGWLAILAAILILCNYFLTLGLLLIFAGGAVLDKRKKEKEKKENEGMGN